MSVVVVVVALVGLVGWWWGNRNTKERENNLKNGGGDQHRIYLRISGVLRDRDIVSSDPGVASLFRFPRCGNWT